MFSFKWLVRVQLIKAYKIKKIAKTGQNYEFINAFFKKLYKTNKYNTCYTKQM